MYIKPQPMSETTSGFDIHHFTGKSSRTRKLPKSDEDQPPGESQSSPSVELEAFLLSSLSGFVYERTRRRPFLKHGSGDKPDYTVGVNPPL